MFKDKRLVKVFKWSMIGAVAGDVAFLAGGYYCYYKLRHSQAFRRAKVSFSILGDFRYKVYKYDPRCVDLYYRANEKYGDGKAREQDYKEWGITNIKSFEFVHLMGL